jgi:hypothetical protein
VAGVSPANVTGIAADTAAATKTRLIVVSVVESPLLFSFRAPASLAPAQPQLALRLLAVRQVGHLVLSLFHLGLRRDLRRLAVWPVADGRQVVHALFRLVLPQDPHQSEACQVGLSLRRRDALVHRGQLVVVSHRV